MTAPLTSLEATTPPVTPSTRISCSRPCSPTRDMIVSNSSRPGKAIHASTNLCTAKSHLPPKNPDVPPISTATITLSVVAAMPTAKYEPRGAARRAPTGRYPSDAQPTVDRTEMVPAHRPQNRASRCAPHRFDPRLPHAREVDVRWRVRRGSRCGSGSRCCAGCAGRRR